MSKILKSHLDFIKILNQHSVRYLVIGGYAVNNYGYDRHTNDLDLLVEPDNANGLNLIKAVDEYGFDIEELQKKNFEKEIIMFSLGSRAEMGHIELTNRIAGIRFTEAFSNRKVDVTNGVEINFIGLNDLIAAKKASGRIKDIDDANHLDQIRGG